MLMYPGCFVLSGIREHCQLFWIIQTETTLFSASLKFRTVLAEISRPASWPKPNIPTIPIPIGMQLASFHFVSCL